MSISVDLPALRKRFQRARSSLSPECEAWFVLTGPSGQDAFDAVQEACAAVSPQARAIRCVGGTYVQLLMKNWEAACTQIAGRLGDTGWDVAVTIPPTFPGADTFSAPRLPFLTLIHQLDPPAATVCRADRLAGHWNLPEPARTHRLERARDWLIEPGRYGSVGQLRMIPASREDVADKLEQLFESNHTVYANSHDSDGELRRDIVFRDWGESSWGASYPGMTNLERADQLAQLLVEFATEIDFGAIQLCPTMMPGDIRFNRMPRESSPLFQVWGSAPQLWASYVPDAHGIQIVNDSQLAKANDLSAWHVDTVAPGRHLVRAKDLRPWFETIQPTNDSPFLGNVVPPEPVLQRARRDFGEMILTSDVADSFLWKQGPSAPFAPDQGIGFSI